MSNSVNNVSGTAVTAAEKPAKLFVRFNSVNEANRWLSTQDSIVITNFATSTATKFSFPANNIVITEVRIEYIRYSCPTNYRYGISEQDFFRLYTSAKLEKLRDKWKAANPDKKCIHCLKNTNRRFLVGTSVGFFAFVKDKFVVLYR